MNRPTEADTSVTTAGKSAYPQRRAQSWLTGWRLASLLATTAAIGTGVVFTWDWLAAGGIFVLFVTVVPCLVMCAVALSMRRSGSGGHEQ